MEETHELYIQILEWVGDRDNVLYPRLVLDDSRRDSIRTVPPPMVGGDEDWTWVMGLFDVDRLSNVFHFN